MCTTCNCFKHKSNDIYYTAFTVILIKNMINKRNHTMTTVHHVSQCSSLRYSFSFSHKCPGLVGETTLVDLTLLTTAWAKWNQQPEIATSPNTDWKAAAVASSKSAMALVGEKSLLHCCSTHRRLWLKQRACCLLTYKQYPYNFECIR